MVPPSFLYPPWAKPSIVLCIYVPWSNTENISHLVVKFSKAEVPKLSLYVEDTRHLLELTEEGSGVTGPQPGGTIPVTMDILNIPWQEGTDAFKEAMEQRVCKSVPTVFLVLSCNLFTFDGTLFLQLFGVPPPIPIFQQTTSKKHFFTASCFFMYKNTLKQDGGSPPHPRSF